MKLRFSTANTPSHRQRGFTLPELFVVLAVLGVVLWLLTPRGGRHGANPNRIRCSSYLKQVALSFKMYAEDNDGRFPWESAAGPDPSLQKQMVWQYFQTISNELGSTKILMCPDDIIRQPNLPRDFSDSPEGLINSSNRNNSVSYFLGIFASTNQFNAILAGDRNLAMNDTGRLYSSRGGNLYEVGANSVWNTQPDQAHHDNAGNYALADGSVQQASTDRLQEALRLARDSYGTNANRFLFPQ